MWKPNLVVLVSCVLCVWFTASVAAQAPERKHIKFICYETGSCKKALPDEPNGPSTEFTTHTCNAYSGSGTTAYDVSAVISDNGFGEEATLCLYPAPGTCNSTQPIACETFKEAECTPVDAIWPSQGRPCAAYWNTGGPSYAQRRDTVWGISFGLGIPTAIAMVAVMVIKTRQGPDSFAFIAYSFAAVHAFFSIIAACTTYFVHDAHSVGVGFFVAIMAQWPSVLMIVRSKGNPEHKWLFASFVVSCVTMALFIILVAWAGLAGQDALSTRVEVAIGFWSVDFLVLSIVTSYGFVKRFDYAQV